MKRMLSLLVVVIMLINLCNVVAFAEAPVTVDYERTSNGIIYVLSTNELGEQTKEYTLDDTTYKITKHMDQAVSLTATKANGLEVDVSYIPNSDTIHMLVYKNGNVKEEFNISTQAAEDSIIEPRASNYVYSKNGAKWAYRLDTRSNNNYYGVKTPSKDYTTPAINPSGNATHQQIIKAAETCKRNINNYNQYVFSDISNMAGLNVKVMDHVESIQNVIEGVTVQVRNTQDEYRVLLNSAVQVYIERYGLLNIVVNLTSSAAAALNLQQNKKLQSSIISLCSSL